MKTLIIMSILALCTTTSYSQSSEEKAITKAITAFSNAGDENDTKSLEQYLDTNYRVIMNRLFGSNDVNIMNRDTYIEKIESKEFGDDKRTIHVKNISINGTTASTLVLFQGEKMDVTSIIILIKDSSNNWKIISDIPIII